MKGTIITIRDSIREAMDSAIEPSQSFEAISQTIAIVSSFFTEIHSATEELQEGRTQILMGLSSTCGT